MASASTEEMRKAAKDVQDRGKQQEDGFKSPADLEGALPSVSLARGCPCRAWCGASSHALAPPLPPTLLCAAMCRARSQSRRPQACWTASARGPRSGLLEASSLCAQDVQRCCSCWCAQRGGERLGQCTTRCRSPRVLSPRGEREGGREEGREGGRERAAWPRGVAIRPRLPLVKRADRRLRLCAHRRATKGRGSFGGAAKDAYTEDANARLYCTEKQEIPGDIQEIINSA